MSRADSEQIRGFAQRLRSMADRLDDMVESVAAGVAGLGGSWQDDRFDEGEAVFREAKAPLAEFGATCREYAARLEERASLVDRVAAHAAGGAGGAAAGVAVGSAAAAGGGSSASGAVQPTSSAYEVLHELSEGEIGGISRAQHRNGANRVFYGKISADPALEASIGRLLGLPKGGLLAHMGSGSVKRNPPGCEWHHNFSQPVLQLLRRDVHRNKALQPILHAGPGRSGGYKARFKSS